MAKNPIIGSVDIGISRLTPDDGELNWTWANGADGGWAVFHAQMITQPISMISPAFPAPISLRELIEAYGNPSHVIASAYHGPDIGSGIFYDLSVIYAPLGIRLHPGGTFKPVLSDDMLFNDVNFYDPADKQGLEPQAMLVPWQGIRKFDFYCRDHEEGYACRGN